LALVLLSWQVLSLARPSVFFPSPWAIAVRAAGIWPELLINSLSSVLVVLLGFLAACVVGILIGVLTARVRVMELVLAPVVDFLRPVPALALFPMFIVLLGVGLRVRVMVTFWTAWPAVALNTFQALRQVDRDVVGAARIDGAGEINLLFKVLFPAGAQTLMTGIRLAMGGAWISVVAAEMLGASAGLGFYVLMRSNGFDFPAMYCGVICIALIGLGFNRGLLGLQKIFDFGGVYEKGVSDGADHVPVRGVLRAARGPVRGLQGVRPGVRGDRPGVLPAERD
jgi:NitT/TauT family transport system permease protein